VLSPLELRQAYLESLEIRLSPNWDLKPFVEDVRAYDTRVEASARKRPSHWDFRVSLDIRLTPREGENCRFDVVSAKVVGLFHLPDETEESLVRTLVPLNCAVILYGIARGIIGQSTGMTPGGSIMVPPVNLVKTLKRRRKRTPAADAAESGARK